MIVVTYDWQGDHNFRFARQAQAKRWRTREQATQFGIWRRPIAPDFGTVHVHDAAFFYTPKDYELTLKPFGHGDALAIPRDPAISEITMRRPGFARFNCLPK